jgi:hypothetical protein
LKDCAHDQRSVNPALASCAALEAPRLDGIRLTSIEQGNVCNRAARGGLPMRARTQGLRADEAAQAAAAMRGTRQA